MTKRMVVFGCLLATGLCAQTGTDGAPISMHNDPATIYSGSINFKFLQRTFIKPDDYKGAWNLGGGNPAAPKVLFAHGHPGPHTVQILKPSGVGGGMVVVDTLTVTDTDKLNIYFNPLSVAPTGDIVIGREIAAGSGLVVPAHAHLDAEFARLDRTPAAPVGGRPGAGSATSGTVSRPDSTTLKQGGVFDNNMPGNSQTPGSPGKPPFVKPDIHKSRVRAQSVANQVWAFRVVEGFFKPTDKLNQKGEWPEVLANKPDPGILPASGDDSAYVWAQYSDPARMIGKVTVTGPLHETKTVLTPDKCTAIHFCHMKDAVDKNDKWTLLPDCDPVEFTCGPKNVKYSWAPGGAVVKPGDPLGR